MLDFSIRSLQKFCTTELEYKKYWKFINQNGFKYSSVFNGQKCYFNRQNLLNFNKYKLRHVLCTTIIF